MPASTDIIDGIDFKLSAGGNNIGGGIDGRLTLEMDLASVTNKETANWEKNLPSIRRWSVAFDSIYMEGSDEITGKDIDVTVGGTSLKGIKQATIEVSTNLEEIVNSTTGLDATRNPNIRSVSLSVDIDYYDPAGTGAGALDAAIEELLGNTTVGLAIAVSFGSSASFTFTGRPVPFELDATNDGHVQGTITFVSTGTVTDATTGEQAGIGSLLDAIFAADKSTSITALLGTSTASNTEYTGTTYVETLTITAPFTDRVDMSGTLQGSGALTKQETT